MSKQKDQQFMKAFFVIILFLVYTIFIPTISLDRIVKIFLDVVYIGFLLYFFKDEFKEAFKITRAHIFKFIGMILLFWLISTIVSGLANMLLDTVLKISLPNNAAQLDLMKSAPVYLMFSMLVFSPIIEELSMTVAVRKLIKNKWLYLLASSLLCGILYVAFSGSPMSYFFIISYALQALVWSIAYLKTDNILVPIGIHLIQNIIMIIGYASII